MKLLANGNPRRIFTEDGFTETDGKELTIAKFRAKLGMDVALIAAPKGAKLPKIYDAEENGKPFEYERVSEDSTNLSNSIKNRIRDGKKQAANIVVFIDRNYYNIKDIERGVNKAIYYDGRKRQIENIIILNRQGGRLYERNIR